MRISLPIVAIVIVLFAVPTINGMKREASDEKSIIGGLSVPNQHPYKRRKLSSLIQQSQKSKTTISQKSTASSAISLLEEQRFAAINAIISACDTTPLAEETVGQKRILQQSSRQKAAPKTISSTTTPDSTLGIATIQPLSSRVTVRTPKKQSTTIQPLASTITVRSPKKQPATPVVSSRMRKTIPIYWSTEFTNAINSGEYAAAMNLLRHLPHYPIAIACSAFLRGTMTPDNIFFSKTNLYQAYISPINHDCLWNFAYNIAINRKTASRSERELAYFKAAQYRLKNQ